MNPEEFNDKYVEIEWSIIFCCPTMQYHFKNQSEHVRIGMCGERGANIESDVKVIENISFCPFCGEKIRYVKRVRK